MTDITNIKQYMEWLAQREGQKVDVSPEAWAHEVATEYLALMAEEILVNEKSLKQDHWNNLAIAKQSYDETKEALNASN